MTETPCLTVLKYQRSSYTSTAIVFDSDLNLYSVEQLRELARVGVQFNIVDVETDARAGRTVGLGASGDVVLYFLSSEQDCIKVFGWRSTCWMFDPIRG